MNLLQQKKVGIPVTFQQADMMEKCTILQKVTHEDNAKFFKARLSLFAQNVIKICTKNVLKHFMGNESDKMLMF